MTRQVIAICANPAIEITYICESFHVGSVINAQISIAPGGKAINVARILKQLEQEVLVLTYFGRHLGEYIEESLCADGIASKIIRHENFTRCSTVIYSEGASASTIIRSSGAAIESNMQDAFFDLVQRNVTGCEVLCLSGGLPAGFGDDFYRRVIKLAHSSGMRMFVDCAGAALREALIERPYFVKINLQEAKSIYLSLDREISPNLLAKKLVILGAQNSLITLGRAGFSGFVNGNCVSCHISPNEESFDIGAGDAMMAGLIYSYCSGHSFLDQLAIATKVAYASTYCKTSGQIDREVLSSAPQPRIFCT